MVELLALGKFPNQALKRVYLSNSLTLQTLQQYNHGSNVSASIV
jgi:hypothetical protein